jgi:hypothetical protein
MTKDSTLDNCVQYVETTCPVGPIGVALNCKDNKCYTSMHNEPMCLECAETFTLIRGACV